MPNKIEMRTVDVDNVELRAITEGEEKQEYVDGLGVVYDREVEVWHKYYEKIRAGAFTKCLSKAGVEVKSYFNHNQNYVLSTTRSNPRLVLEDTADGLIFRSPIPNTTYGRDLVENLRRKNVRGASFSFTVPKGGDIVTRDENDCYHREIIEAVIYEIGPVTNPAYHQTKANVRSAEELMAEFEERTKPVTPEPKAETPIPETGGGVSETKLRNKELNENSLSLMKNKLYLIERSAT